MEHDKKDQANNNQQPAVDPVALNTEASTPVRSTRKKSYLLAAVAFTVVIIFGVVAWTLTANEDAADDVATSTIEKTETEFASAVTLVEGTVESSIDGETWSAVSGGETIEVGNYVRTLADSRAVILLDDGSAIRLDASTRMQLTAADTSLSEVTLHSGQVYTRVVESEDRTFAVVTSHDRFEALGTAYKTSTSDGTDAVEVYQSKVMVDSDGTQVEEGNKYDTASRQKTSIDLDTLKDDDFLQWNKQQDSQDDDFKDLLGVLNIDTNAEDDTTDEDSSEDAPSASANIVLSATQHTEGVALNWTMNDASAPDGFKVVFDATDSTPSYKENSSHYVGGDVRTHVVGLDDGRTYYFRVCIYRAAGGSCDTYSNTVSMKAPLVEKEEIVSGEVELAISDNLITWEFGGSAPHGFKVVLSSSPSPVYPANSIQYVGPETTKATLPEKPAGTYYVRVCKYTADAAINSGCMNYSNQVEYLVESGE